MVLQKMYISKLGIPSLEKKISELGLPSLENISRCVHVLEDKGMKGIILTYTVEILWPKRFQELESQVLNSAIIVKTWGHGIAKNISKLGIPSLENMQDFRTLAAKS